MKLSAFKELLKGQDEVRFTLPNGKEIPAHFHVTEVGQIDKNFIDCGGTIRKESRVNFQLWASVDLYHRLKPQKLVNIITLSEDKLGITDEEIEVEYQGNTIEKFGLSYTDGKFHLTNTHTDCLASDACGIPVEKAKKVMAEISSATSNCCSPESGCC